ncbi:MAG TPA: hypothetical protein VHW65_05775, partial [Gemmatimonadales bacterium]|nr:hypothetical protein [Gemmatimonadales bacterium]
ETAHRLGRFDPITLRTESVALRSIANAIEDLEEVDDFEDEVDRTMLLDTIRADIIESTAQADAESGDPAVPVRHALEAIQQGLARPEDEDAEAALNDRITALPDFLASSRRDSRAAPDFLVWSACVAAQLLDDALLAAEEYVDTATVRPAQVALNEHLDWLRADDRTGGIAGVGEDVVEARLATLSVSPGSVQGTLRVLELRCTGIERGLVNAAEELGPGAWREQVASVRDTMTEPDFDELTVVWADEWQRVGEGLRALGLPVVGDEAPDPPTTPDDLASLAAMAVRGHAVRMLAYAAASQPRVVRQILVAPGLLAGWGRTVAALLRGSPIFETPAQRLMLAHCALVDAAAAEADLLLQSRRATFAELVERTHGIIGLDEPEARRVMHRVGELPFAALAAALAHEGWQAWYAEVGGDPVDFVRHALKGGGLSVPLARWALTR